MKIAALDIGTNTCNISICEYDGKNLNFIYKDKKVVNLINEEYYNDLISYDSINRLINVLSDYKILLKKEFGVENYFAYATSGVREAVNKEQIVDLVYSATGIKIMLIDGFTEAELVWKGVKNAKNFENEKVLIVDIGGGSIEFCIAVHGKLIDKFSYKLGVARLLKKFNFHDPLTFDDISLIKNLFNENMKTLFSQVFELKIKTLVGSSGSFETFANLVKYECSDCFIDENSKINEIIIKDFVKIYDKLINYNYEQRKNMPGMEIIRVKMIPIAAVITHFLIEKLNLEKFYQSNYSIKEGIIFDFIEKLNLD